MVTDLMSSTGQQEMAISGENSLLSPSRSYTYPHRGTEKMQETRVEVGANKSNGIAYIPAIFVGKSVWMSFYKHGLIASGILIAGAVYLAVAYTPLFGLISLIPLSVIVPLIIKIVRMRT